MNKKYLILVVILVVLTAVIFGWFYFFREQGPKQYKTKAFPNALKIMDEYTLEISVAGLNKEYRLLAEGNNAYNHWIEIGILKKRLGDYQGAESAWQEAGKVNPEHALWVGDLADLYLYTLADYQKAEEYYQKAIEKNPYNVNYYYGLADLYRYNVTEKANLIESMMVNGAKTNPTEAANYSMYLAHYFAKEGQDLAKAKDYSEKTLILNPGLKDQLPDLE